MVVLDALPRGEVVFHHGGANSGDLVGANGRAHTATTNGDPALHLAGGYCASERHDEIGVVVAGRENVGAEVDDVVSGCPETSEQVLFQDESAVVGRDA
jgi:hypothetical protein